mmetsp:Transcript_11529/g.13222  ORF Transcript_11529/g.13222 Transcript_11529/m.13222 type:complete len:145 (+) Transcript_11529:1045-1479(+)
MKKILLILTKGFIYILDSVGFIVVFTVSSFESKHFFFVAVPQKLKRKQNQNKSEMISFIQLGISSRICNFMFNPDNNNMVLQQQNGKKKESMILSTFDLSRIIAFPGRKNIINSNHFFALRRHQQLGTQVELLQIDSSVVYLLR